MARIDLALHDNGQVWEEFCHFMRQQGASEADEQLGMTRSGWLTDIFWINFELQSGESVEVEFDGFVGTSISGEDALVKRLARTFKESRRDA